MYRYKARLSLLLAPIAFFAAAAVALPSDPPEEAVSVSLWKPAEPTSSVAHSTPPNKPVTLAFPAPARVPVVRDQSAVSTGTISRAAPASADPWGPVPLPAADGSVVVPASYSTPPFPGQPANPRTRTDSQLAPPAQGAAPGALPAPELLPELAMPRPTNSDVQQQAELLKAQREALKAERESIGVPTDSIPSGESRRIPELRRRATELMLKAASQRKSTATVPVRNDNPPRDQDPPEKVVKEPAKPFPVQPQRPDPNAVKKGSSADVAGAANPEAPPSVPKVVDPLALGEALFRNGEYAGALTAFRQLDLVEFKAEQRLMVQYLSACCLRKLGKFDEAVALYRDVANAKGDPVVAECAQWELGAVRWRHDIETEIERLRKERKQLAAKQ